MKTLTFQHKSKKRYQLYRGIIAFFLLLSAQLSLGDELNYNVKFDNNKLTATNLIETLVLDIDLVDKTNDASQKENNALLLEKFSNIFREQLKQEAVFKVVDDEKSMALMKKTARRQSLHRCGGCELALGEKVGAKQVIVPWVVRISARVQTLMIEIRDVETSTVIFKKPYVFKGSTEKGWMHTILFAIQDLKREMKEF